MKKGLTAKKALALMLVGAMALSLLAACSGPAAKAPAAAATTAAAAENGDKPATTTEAATAAKEAGGKILFWKSPHSDIEAEIWAPVIKAFMDKNPDVTVEHLVVPWDQFETKFTTAFAGAEPPDVSYMTEWFPKFAQVGELLDLKDVLAKKRGDYSDSAIDYCTYEGKLVGIPFIAINSVMFYNKDIFKTEGIVNNPTNWDEMLDAAIRVTKDTNADGEIDQWGIMFPLYPSVDIWQPVTYLCQAGAPIWNKNIDGTGLTGEPDSPAIKGAKFFYDLFHTHRVSPSFENIGSEDEAKALLYEGHIAMYPGQIQESSALRENSESDWGVFLLPKGPAEDPKMAAWGFNGMGMMSIATRSKRIEASKRFLEFITTPEYESMYIGKVGFFSPNPATNALMYHGDEIYETAAKGIAENFVMSPASPLFGAIWDNYKSMFEALIRDMKTPEQAVKDCIADTTAAIAAMKQ